MIDLTQIFENVNGASFISIDAETVPVLKGGKANPLQGKVIKKMIGASVMVFQNKKKNGYEAMVFRRLAQEGKDPNDFQISERPWGTRLPNLPIVEHKGTHYLEVIFLNTGTVQYYVDGQQVSHDQIPGLDSEEGAQGGLEHKVIIRTFKAENLRKIKIDGVEIINPV